MPGPHGILSRDENGTDEPGHFLIATSDEGHVIVRNQVPGASAWVCSEAPVTPGEWVKLDVNFGDGGGLVLFVDGVRQSSTATLPFTDGIGVDIVSCGTGTSAGLQGNMLPFFFGGASTRATDATVDPPNFFMAGGAIDEVILRTRRLGGA